MDQADPWCPLREYMIWSDQDGPDQNVGSDTNGLDPGWSGPADGFQQID